MSTKGEAVFTYAVALQQSGRLKSSIYAKNRTIYILNMDKTVLLKFELEEDEKFIFKSEISFYADDYDSETFVEDQGKMIFIQKERGLKRKKICRVPDKSFDDVEKMFSRFENQHPNSARWYKNVLSLLDEDLSHLEISFENNSFVILQRDIYTGSLIKIEKTKSGFVARESISLYKDTMTDFKSIGLRTNDFIALFSFSDWVKFYFPSSNKVGYILVRGELSKSELKKVKMFGVISQCYYDEMGKVSLSNGSQLKRSR